jgi:F0F1-type ATP synthase assembly protein I
VKKDYFNYARYANFALSFGVTSIAAMLLCFFGGQWLDKKLGTSPAFLLIGIFLGIAVTFKSLMTELKILNKSEELYEEEEKEKNGGKSKQ